MTEKYKNENKIIFVKKYYLKSMLTNNSITSRNKHHLE